MGLRRNAVFLGQAIPPSRDVFRQHELLAPLDEAGREPKRYLRPSRERNRAAFPRGAIPILEPVCVSVAKFYRSQVFKMKTNAIPRMIGLEFKAKSNFDLPRRDAKVVGVVHLASSTNKPSVYTIEPSF
jgi:hypothetical protein